LIVIQDASELRRPLDLVLFVSSDHIFPEAPPRAESGSFANVRSIAVLPAALSEGKRIGKWLQTNPHLQVAANRRDLPSEDAPTNMRLSNFPQTVAK
jgi:hypothetical protein